tara:strand:- start:300 stop:974 length:675 start_codon:yes stop_codon:yes gene_type:complete
MKKKTVVLLSGGLDSSVVLSEAIKQKFETHCLSFKYQQRHKTEIFFAKKQVEEQQPKTHKIVNLDFFGGSSLTDNIKVPKHKDVKLIPNTIPNTYVPGRNLIFLSYALGYAEYLGCNSIFIGVNSVDYSGYPDCRPEFIRAFERISNLSTKKGLESNNFIIYTPLIKKTKKEIIELGRKNKINFKNTLSCYSPKNKIACGQCDACLLRLKGFNEANISDPIDYI